MLTQEEFSKGVKSLTKTLEKSKEQIQALSVFAIVQSVEHRNADAGTRLLQAVDSKGVFKSTLVSFMETYGNLKFKAGAKGKSLDKFEFKENPKGTTDEEFLMSVDWATFKKEKVTSIHDVEKEFFSFVSRMEKAHEKGTTLAIPEVDGKAFGVDGRITILELLGTIRDSWSEEKQREHEEKAAEITGEHEEEKQLRAA